MFNHFPTKVDLAFAGREEGITQFVTAIAGRAGTDSVLDVFRAMTQTVLDVFVAGGDEDLLAVAKIIRGSRALQERLTVGWEAGAAAITAAIRETSGAADDDLVPAIVARTLWFMYRSIFLAALNGRWRGGPRAGRRRLRVAATGPTTSSRAGWRSTARAIRHWSQARDKLEPQANRVGGSGGRGRRRARGRAADDAAQRRARDGPAAGAAGPGGRPACCSA